MLPRSDLVYKTSAWLLCQAGMKWRKPEVMLPSHEVERSVFETVPARLSGSASMKSGESPRCCPVLRGLRDRCIAAMLATRKAEVSGHAPQAAVAAPSGFQPAAARSSALTSRKWLPRMDSRHQPPGSEPGALRIELQGNRIRQSELHRPRADTSGVRRYQRFGGIGNGRAPRCCPEYLADPNGADCCLPRAR